MTWFEALRLALAILQILKELKKESPDKAKAKDIAVNAIPEKYKVKLYDLTDEERKEITDMFLK
jgi:uncharacterized protein YpuA (DUF1002 family)